MLALAAHRAQLRSVAASAPPDKLSLASAKAVFKGSVSSADREWTLKGAPAWATKGPDGDFTILTLPRQLEEDVWGASLGPSLQSCNPVIVNPAAVGRAVVTVVPLALAEACGAPFLPPEQHSPGNTNAPNSNEPPTDIGADEGSAVFAIIPLALAVTRDFDFPPEWDFSKPVPPEFIESSPHQALWMLGQQ